MTAVENNERTLGLQVPQCRPFPNSIIHW